MDTKKLEMIAEQFISSTLSKYEILVSKPLFDSQGVDLLIFKELDEQIKVGFIQSKGRSIERSNSNIQIPKIYVKPNFIVLLYTLLENKKENLYVFFSEDINKWRIKDDDYYLNIPQKINEDNYFKDYLINKDMVKRIINKLEAKPGYISINNILKNDNNLIDYEFQKWSATGIFPTLKTLQYLWNLYDESNIKLEEELFLLISSMINDEEDSDMETYPSFEFIASLIGEINHESDLITNNRLISCSQITGAMNYNYICYKKYIYTEVEIMINDSLKQGVFIIIEDQERDEIEIFLERKVQNPFVYIKRNSHGEKSNWKNFISDLTRLYKDCITSN